MKQISLLNPAFLTLLIGSIILSLESTIAFSEESHPGLAAEAMYTEAVVAYNKKQTDEALRILDEVLKSNPSHIEALELKALALKTKGDDNQSQKVYTQLIKLKPETERGPYHFELGVILNRQKKPALAQAQFERAVALKFNEIPARLFMGLIAFNKADYSNAEKHFAIVKTEGTPELKVISRFYLGLINFKSGYGAGGTAEMIEARNLAAEMPDNATVKDIRTAADGILAPFSRGQLFGNISLLGQYDSNVSLVPTGSTSSAQASGKSTGKVNMTGGVGWMSSPISLIQWVAGYRFSGNKNTNDQTKTYEFLTNTPSLYLNYQPLARTTGGLKLEGNLMFQDQLQDSASNSYVFRKYSLGADIGGLIKQQTSRNLNMQLDLDYRPQKNYSDSGQSGGIYGARFSVHAETSSRFLSPTASASYELASLESDENRYGAFGFGVSNRIPVTRIHSVTFSVDYLNTNYSKASTPRTDGTITARANWMSQFTPKWSVLGDLTFISNGSNQADLHSYSRIMAGAGVGYSL